MSAGSPDARTLDAERDPPSARSRRSHPGCMVCGDRAENPWSLGLVFTETADGWVETRFRPTVRRRRPVHLGRSVVVRARLRGHERSVPLTEGIITRDGEILARVVAKHMEPRDRLPPDKSA